MKPITSRENPLYKELKQLATSAQARRKAGRSLLDGVHLCESYLQHRGVPPLCVVSEAAMAHPEVASIVAQCDGHGCDCIVLSDSLYQGISQVEHGVQVLFVIETPQLVMPAVLDGAAVLLDNVQDPGNLGSILRSAAAAGIVDIFCSPGTAACWSPKVLRAGMGAHFVLRIVENVDLALVMQSAKVPVCATSSYASQTLYDVDLTQPVAWLFGHEGQGVAEELLALSTMRVGIPQIGAVESLNVAASAAVCFFEQVRQQRGAS